MRDINVENFDLSKITTYQAGVVQAAMHRMLQKLCDDILQPFGITKMQWLIIGTVRDAGKDGMRISDLANKLNATIPYLTTSINLLEARSILLRKDNNEDSRSKLVSVNPRYVKKCHEIEATLRDGLRQSIYSQIDPKEFGIYLKVMYQLLEVGKKSI
jgi:DNA-binding MarR family transcriptional regulator